MSLRLQANEGLILPFDTIERLMALLPLTVCLYNLAPGALEDIRTKFVNVSEFGFLSFRFIYFLKNNKKFDVSYGEQSISDILRTYRPFN